MKVYMFECREHPEAGGEGPMAGQLKDTLSFEIRYAGEPTGKSAKCPLCGADCGVFGPWREAPGSINASEWQSKWAVAITVWEKVASELGAVKHKLVAAINEQLAIKAAFEAKPNVKGSDDLN